MSAVGVPAQAPKTPSKNTIETAITRVSKTPGEYFQVVKPARPLKLNNAPTHVGKNFSTQPLNNRFVYWPDYRTAGFVSDIYNVFRAATFNTVNVGALNALSGGAVGSPAATVALTEDVIRANSIDPLNDAHVELIKALKAQLPAKVGGKARFPLETYILIGEALKETKKAKATGVAAPAAPKGGRAPATKRAEAIAKFNNLMGMVLAGQAIDEVIKVSAFDATKYTGALKLTPVPKTGGRAQLIRPQLTINGATYAVPVVVKPENVANFRAYVDNVIAASTYAEYAEAIKASFNARLAGAPAAPMTAVSPKMAPVVMPKTTLPGTSAKVMPGASALPKASGLALPKASGLALPKASGLALPKASGLALPKGSGLALPKASGLTLPRPKSPSGSPTSPARSPPPAGLPRPSGLATPSKAGGLRLPTAKGLPRPGQ